MNFSFDPLMTKKSISKTFATSAARAVFACAIFLLFALKTALL
jgi:hypothetical protein